MTAGSDIANGCASSLTEMLSLAAEPRQQRAPRRIRQRGEGAVQNLIAMLNHLV